MILNILIVFFSLITLVVLHEFGHFIVAKKFGVRVEEFGIGFPPRLFGKKIGETLYSLNLIPFGAFVRVFGEEGGIEDAQSFSGKPIWQRALILLAGVVAFWIVGIILLSIAFNIGTSVAISDEDKSFIIEPKVQIVGIASNSPAEQAGIMIRDNIKQLSLLGSDEYFSITKVKDVQELTEKYKGENVILTIERGGEIIDKELFFRTSSPEGEGVMGVMLIRTVNKSYPFFQAIIKGVEATGSITYSIVIGLKDLLVNLVGGKGMPEGAQLLGPIGVGSLAVQATKIGVSYFLQFIALLSIYFAVFNLLPIPALDGGKLLFLLIEKIKGSPVNQKKEQIITATFFFLLISLMIWVTAKDIIKLF